MDLKPQYENSYGLVIGINDYPERPLNFATNDADSVAAALEQFGFPKKNVTVLKDAKATRSAIMRRMAELATTCGPDDRVLVFFAGHGTTAESRRGPVGMLVPVDGKISDSSSLIRW